MSKIRVFPKRPKGREFFLDIFIYLLTTKVSYLQKNKCGHAKSHYTTEQNYTKPTISGLIWPFIRGVKEYTVFPRIVSALE